MRSRDAERGRVSAAIEEVDGRDVRIGERWLVDFGSACHLGLDLDEEVIDAVPEYLARWGAQASWSPPTVLHERLSSALTRLVGCERLLLAPSIERAHLLALPALAGTGTVFLDDRAGRSLVDAAAVAGDHGATVRPLRCGDPDRLVAQLRGGWRRPGLICVEGVDPLTGAPAALAALATVARDHGALLYVQDTAALGVLGERSPFEPSPYGIRGSGTAAHLDADPAALVIAASLSSLCASPVAFVASSEPVSRPLDAAAAATGPCPQFVAALAIAIEGLGVNERRGDLLRARLHRLAERALGPLRAGERAARGIPAFPAMELERGAREALLEHGIHAPARGPTGGPVVRITAAHTDEQVDQLRLALDSVPSPVKLRSVPAE